MRKVVTKVYKFNELSDEAKKAAIGRHRNRSDYYHQKDAMESLFGFIKHFDATLYDCSADFTCESGYLSLREVPSYMDFFQHVEIDGDYEERKENAKFLYNKWIQNKLDELGEYDKDTLKGLGLCKLTGTCHDEDLIDGFRIAYMDKGERDMEKLLSAGFKNWLRVCSKDYESQFTEEGFSDYCEANEFEFLENGKRYNK
jgi:hypothetical protein